MSYDQKELQQYSGRNRLSLLHGPVYGASGHYPSVITTTTQEIPFEDSQSALRYMKSVGKKDPNARVIKMQSHARFISRGDD